MITIYSLSIPERVQAFQNYINCNCHAQMVRSWDHCELCEPEFLSGVLGGKFWARKATLHDIKFNPKLGFLWLPSCEHRTVICCLRPKAILVDINLGFENCYSPSKAYWGGSDPGLRIAPQVPTYIYRNGNSAAGILLDLELPIIRRNQGIIHRAHTACPKLYQ